MTGNFPSADTGPAQPAASVRQPARPWQPCRLGPQLRPGRPHNQPLRRPKPYNAIAVPPDGGLLKNEVDAHCCAIAAKRYARCRLDQNSQPKLVSDEEQARFWTSLAGGATAIGDVPCHRDTPR